MYVCMYIFFEYTYTHFLAALYNLIHIVHTTIFFCWPNDRPVDGLRSLGRVLGTDRRFEEGSVRQMAGSDSPAGCKGEMVGIKYGRKWWKMLEGLGNAG